MNTMEVGSRLYKHVYIGELITLFLSWFLIALEYSTQIAGFQIEDSPLDSQRWVLGSWASIWGSGFCSGKISTELRGFLYFPFQARL